MDLATDLPSEDSDDGLAPQQAREEAHRRFLAALQTHVNQHAEHLIATYNVAQGNFRLIDPLREGGPVFQCSWTTPGSVTCTLRFVAWNDGGSGSRAETSRLEALQNSMVKLVNSSLGQRGLLLRELQVGNVAVRMTSTRADFVLWLPILTEQVDEAYAATLGKVIGRLPMAEVQQYFPFLDLHGREDYDVFALPFSGMTAVPKALQTDAPEGERCEMFLCTTKQKRRKGVPYCGTCRKFIEETVRWYCDTYHRHPASEREAFLNAVQTERYQCKNSHTDCKCKSCQSLRRFQELFPHCEKNLHEFKRRAFMFPEENARPAGDAGGVGRTSSASRARRPAKSRKRRRRRQSQPEEDEDEEDDAEMFEDESTEQTDLTAMDTGLEHALAAPVEPLHKQARHANMHDVHGTLLYEPVASQPAGMHHHQPTLPTYDMAMSSSGANNHHPPAHNHLDAHQAFFDHHFDPHQPMPLSPLKEDVATLTADGQELLRALDIRYLDALMANPPTDYWYCQRCSSYNALSAMVCQHCGGSHM